MVLWHQYQETENIRIVRNHCFFGKFEEVIKWQIFRFNEDFANNWKSGQIVTCEEKEEGYLVDKVTLIEKD